MGQIGRDIRQGRGDASGDCGPCPACLSGHDRTDPEIFSDHEACPGIGFRLRERPSL